MTGTVHRVAIYDSHFRLTNIISQTDIIKYVRPLSCFFWEEGLVEWHVFGILSAGYHAGLCIEYLLASSTFSAVLVLCLDLRSGQHSLLAQSDIE